MNVSLGKVILSGAIATGISFVGFVVEPVSAQVSLTQQDNPFNTELHNSCHEHGGEHGDDGDRTSSSTKS